MAILTAAEANNSSLKIMLQQQTRSSILQPRTRCYQTPRKYFFICVWIRENGSQLTRSIQSREITGSPPLTVDSLSSFLRLPVLSLHVPSVGGEVVRPQLPETGCFPSSGREDMGFSLGREEADRPLTIVVPMWAPPPLQVKTNWVKHRRSWLGVSSPPSTAWQGQESHAPGGRWGTV